MAKPVRKRRDPAASVHFPRKVEDPACGPATTSVLTDCTKSVAGTSTSTSGPTNTAGNGKSKRKTKKVVDEDEWFCPCCSSCVVVYVTKLSTLTHGIR